MCHRLISAANHLYENLVNQDLGDYFRVADTPVHNLLPAASHQGQSEYDTQLHGCYD